MGILSRRRERLVSDITKALAGTMPAAAEGVVTDAVPLVNAIANQGQQPMQTQRGPTDLPWAEPVTAFSPGRPQGPVPVDPRLPESGRALPRVSEFPVSWNTPGAGQPLVPWSVLRRFAAQVDIVRLCIGVRKKELTSVDWHISVRQDRVQRMAQENGSTPARARAQAQQDFSDEIDRLTTFWQRPDKLRRLTFAEWFGMFIEEVMVLDALSIYPHPDMAGRLHSLEIIDGATIKPLLDHRGAFPQPPQPAYQQILWGFPRGEFHLSGDDTAQFSTDELIYRPRERRTWTPYGFSPVEQALISGDLYLKRQAWLRSEYADGVIPSMLMLPPESFTWTPDQVRQYETNINMELSGNTQARMRARMLPPGVATEFPDNFGEKYKSELDEYLIKLLCAFFDVMPSEIGFVQKGGLGGAGHQSGEANSVQRIGNKPFLEWVADILNEVNQTYLGAPPELTFVFDLEESEDEETKANVSKSNLSVGKRTLNDERSDDGLPLYDFPEADEPFVITANGPVFIKGLMEQHEASIAASVAGSNTSVKQSDDIASGKVPDPALQPKGDEEDPEPDPNAPPEKPKPDPAADPVKDKAAEADELKAFERFKRNRTGKTWRDFTFKHIAPDTAAMLNKAASPKGKARTGPGYDSHKALVKHYSARIGQALAAAFPHTDHVVMQFLSSRQKAATGDSAARGMLESEMDSTELADALTELTRNAWGAGIQNGLEQLGLSPSWDTWTPGHADAAAKIGGDGLQDLLDQQGVTITSILDQKMDQLANRMSYALDNGWSVDQTANDIRNLLEDPSRSEMIANTETNRAMTSATMETYGKNGVESVDWLLSYAPCELCTENADAAPIPYGDEWPNGDAPVHPNCECSIAPAAVAAEDQETDDAAE